MAELRVWMNGEEVASWQETTQGSRLTYLPSWLASPAARPLSLSLPLLPSFSLLIHHIPDYMMTTLQALTAA